MKMESSLNKDVGLGRFFDLLGLILPFPVLRQGLLRSICGESQCPTGRNSAVWAGEILSAASDYASKDQRQAPQCHTTNATTNCHLKHSTKM